MTTAAARSFVLACGLSAALGECTRADELFRQNPEQIFSGPSSQDARNTGGPGLMYVTADNFPAQAAWTITGLEFWGGYPQVAPGATEGFMIRFYQDNAGTIGPMISTQDVMTFTETQFYTHSNGWPGYHYTLNLNTPFVPPAAGQYWVAVVAILPFGGGGPTVQWGWVAAAPGQGNPPNAVQSIFGGPFNSLQGDQSFVLHGTTGGPACYANCDSSTATPVLNVGDFTCFLTRFASGDPYATCDASASAPTLNVADFTCFLTKYAAGCP